LLIKRSLLELNHRALELWGAVKEKIGRTTAIFKDTEVYVNIMLDAAYKDIKLQDLSSKYGINISTIKNIVYGTQHLYLKSIDAEAWDLMVSKKRKKGCTSNKVLISPDGEKFPLSVSSVPQIAGIFSISKYGLYKVTSGRCASYKGWKLA